MALGEWCLEVKRPGRELHLCQNQKVNKQIQANWWLGFMAATVKYHRLSGSHLKSAFTRSSEH